MKHPQNQIIILINHSIHWFVKKILCYFLIILLFLNYFFIFLLFYNWEEIIILSSKWILFKKNNILIPLGKLNIEKVKPHIISAFNLSSEGNITLSICWLKLYPKRQIF